LKLNFIKLRFIEYLKSNLKKPIKFLKIILGKHDWEYLRYKFNYSDETHPEFKKLDPLSKDLYEAFHVTILPTLLRNYDRYSMTSGVEIRMPFMDHRLVTYSFSLPWTSKVGGTYTKRIMRDALKGILPEEIRTRRDKIGWNAPIHEWFRGPLKAEIDDLFTKNLLSKNNKKAWELFQNKNNPNMVDGQNIWRKLLPELWKSSLLK